MVLSGQHQCQWEKVEVGVFAGPDVSESGLVLALDAGNNKSHSTNRFVSYGSGNVTETVYPPIRGTNNLTRVATGTVVGGYTVKTTDVVYSYALGSNGCHYQGHDVPIPGGVYGTFSFDYLVTGATNYPSTNFLANFENVGNSFAASGSAPNSLQDVWQRVSFTGGPSSANGAVRTLLYPGGCGGRLADSGTIYFRNPRVEWTNVDTGTENFSSMPNTTTWYDMSGRGNNGTLTNTPYFFIGNTSTGSNGYISFDGTDDYVGWNTLNDVKWQNWNSITIETVFKLVSYSGATSGRQYLFDFRDSGGVNGSFGCFYDNSENSPFGFKLFYNTVGNSYEEPLITTFSLNSLIYYQVTFDKTSSTDNIKHYINGVNVFTRSITINSNTTNTGKIWVGRYGGGGYQWNGNIYTFKVYNRALTAAEVQQNFNATRSRFGV